MCELYILLRQLPTSHSLLGTCVCQGLVHFNVGLFWRIFGANYLTDVPPAGRFALNDTSIYQMEMLIGFSFFYMQFKVKTILKNPCFIRLTLWSCPTKGILKEHKDFYFIALYNYCMPSEANGSPRMARGVHFHAASGRMLFPLIELCGKLGPWRGSV